MQILLERKTGLCYTLTMNKAAQKETILTENHNIIPSLISKISNASAIYLKLQLEKLGLMGIVPSHGFILYHLAQRGSMTMTELTRSINRDKSTTTALVKKLEQEGYVERIPSTEDNRVTRISLSKKDTSYADLTKKISQSLTETCCNGFTKTEIQTLFSLLKRIEKNFERGE